MIRTVFVTGMAVVMTLSTMNAQQHPDLSGRWVRVEQPKDALRHDGPYATSLTINQTPSAITLDLLLALFSSGQTISEREIATPVTYTTDGLDHKLVFEVPPSIANRSTVAVVRLGEDRTYRAVYGRDQLLVVTHETYTIRAPGKAPLINQRMIREALRLGQDGRLTVERLVLSDPLPAGFYFSGPTDEPTPTPSRVTYQRAQ